MDMNEIQNDEAITAKGDDIAEADSAAAIQIPKARRPWGKYALLLAVVAVLLILLTFAMQIPANGMEAEEDPWVQGNLKVTDINLNVKTGGMIKEVIAEEGMYVSEGAILLTLDSDTLEAKKTQLAGSLSAAKSQYSAAQAQYEKAKNGARTEEVDMAKAAYDLAGKTYSRMAALLSEGAISYQEFDQVSAQYESAKLQYEMAASGARTEDISAAKANMDAAAGLITQAEGGLMEIETYLQDSVVTAPCDGTIVSININAGELVSTGMPLMVLRTDEKPWIEVSILETELEGITLGGHVDIKFLTYEGEVFTGEIVKINQNPSFATKRSTANNGDFDVLSYVVKVEILDETPELFPGMTTLVQFNEGSNESDKK